MTKKTYILDTSVLLAEGKEALYAFKGKDVVVPLPVIKELEHKKTDPMLGFIARSVLRAIERLRVEHGKAILSGVKVDDEGGTIRIEVNHVSEETVPSVLKKDKATDTRILIVAHNLAEEVGHDNLVLVSNDLTMRLVAEVSVKIHAEEFRHNSIQGSYTGLLSAGARKDVIDALYVKNTNLDISELELTEKDLPGYNMGAIVKRHDVSSQSVLASIKGTSISKIDDAPVFEIHGRSAEQRIALHHLMDDDIKVVSLGGPAGTGKTFLALAAGLEQTIEKNAKYKRVLVFRPLQAVGNENLGYLPGTEEEKMGPWAAAIYDALDNIMGNSDSGQELRRALDERGVLEVLPVTHIRGRTLNNAFIIIDEAQNLERNVILSVLSRLGEGSKAVLSWDAAQTDNLHIGRNDGVVAVVDKFRKEDLFAHVTLQKSERSKVAERAAKILDDFLS